MNLINVCVNAFVFVGFIVYLRLVNAQGPPGGQMTQQFINSIVKLHNEYRRSEGASNMKQLKWSPKLQQDAQLWADKCRYAHAYGKWGENLFKVESHLPDDVLIERAVNEWYFEKMSWKFTPDCSEACHYTQVVWAVSEEIGCAFKRCPTLFLREEFIPNGWMLVCYYSPQGNIIGEMPYTHGKPCSACERGYSCDRGLCYKPEPSHYLPPAPGHPPPRAQPTARVYRAPPHPVHPQHQQPPPRHSQPHQRPQAPAPYRAPPPQHQRQPENKYQPPPPPQQQQVYQQPIPGHSPARQPQVHQGPRPHAANPPQVYQQQQQPAAQPTNSRPVAHQRVWRGHEQIYQPQPKLVQQPSQVQYISGKVLTGWIQPQTTKGPDTNLTNFQPLSAPAAPVHAYQQYNPANQPQQHVKPQPVHYTNAQNPNPDPQYRHGIPQPQPVQYQQQLSAQTNNAAEQMQTNIAPANAAPYQQHYQSQPAHHRQQIVDQPTPGQYQQPVNPAHVQASHPPFPAQHQIPEPQQSALHQIPHDPHNHYPKPQPVPYTHGSAHGPQYAANISNQNSVHAQQPNVPNNQEYIHMEGQGQSLQYYQEPSPPQTGSVFVDPRPIYVPPAPAPPTTTTPVPPPPTCYDVDKNCPHWGVYCKSNPYVHDNCRMTCSTCTIPTPPPVPVKTTAAPTTTPAPENIPSHPPSPITPRPQQSRPVHGPPAHNNYPTTSSSYLPPTTGYNNNYVPTTPTAYGATTQAPGNMSPPGGGPAFGPCRNFDNRCRQWAKYCGLDEYVDDMCRLTCMRCPNNV